MSLDLKKKKILNNLSLAKKYQLLKKINNHIFSLKNLLTKENEYRGANTFLPSTKLLNNNKRFLLIYIVFFSFSPKNTLLHITDVWGNLKFRYSAGLVGVTGKQKKNRILVLTRLFNMLQRLKMTFLKNKPIALHLSNVKSYKYFIIKRLKKDFFIKVIKNYETYPYNGCRKKKRLHKRQRSKRKNG
uniref:ribosomal protein S11 n=1 Tax=Haslea karadagensis TaxID=1146996 RepID=UPI00220C6121|nr:ribosomal protein S11 [Haslea karadagensis]UXN44283.1 ribosomal protein S11 [Haslea karadagensis]